MDKKDVELICNTLVSTQKELKETKLVLGTLIIWLQGQIGKEAAAQLLADLNTMPAEK